MNLSSACFSYQHHEWNQLKNWESTTRKLLILLMFKPHPKKRIVSWGQLANYMNHDVTKHGKLGKQLACLENIQLLQALEQKEAPRASQIVLTMMETSSAFVNISMVTAGSCCPSNVECKQKMILWMIYAIIISLYINVPPKTMVSLPIVARTPKQNIFGEPHVSTARVLGWHLEDWMDLMKGFDMEASIEVQGIMK